MNITLVRQLEQYDCTVACIAMILKIDYIKAHDILEYKSACIERATIVKILEQYNYIVRSWYDNRIEYLADCYLCSVKVYNYSSFNHAVVMDKYNNVFDPNKDNICTLHDYFSIDNIMNIFMPKAL